MKAILLQSLFGRLNDAVNSVTGHSDKLKIASIGTFTECQDASVDKTAYYCMNADRIGIGNFHLSLEDIFRQERAKKVCNVVIVKCYNWRYRTGNFL